MKLRLYKNDIYQDTLSKITPLQIFIEEAKKLSPGYGGINDTIMQLSVDKENLLKQIKDLEDKHNYLLKQLSDSNNNNELLTKYKNDINLKDKEIEKLKSEIEELNNDIKGLMNNNNKKDNLNNKILFKNSKEFKKILFDFEEKIKSSREDFCGQLKMLFMVMKKKIENQ